MTSVFKNERPIIDYLVQNIKHVSKIKLSIAVFLMYQNYLKQYGNQLLYPNTLFPGRFTMVNGIPETKLTHQYTIDYQPKTKYQNHMNYQGFSNQIDNQNINSFMHDSINQLNVIDDHGMLYRLSFEDYLNNYKTINAKLIQQYV